MKSLNSVSTTTLLVFFFTSWIQVSGGIPDYIEADALKFMEVFDKFGNKGVHIDFDNMILIFLHEDEEQKKTYKGFHVETSREFLPLEENVAPDRNVLVYRLTPYIHSAPNQSVTLDDQFDISEYEHEAINERINVSKAYYKFMGFFVPHDYPHADIRGPETLDLVRKRRYTHDVETGDVTKIEEFQIRKVENGGMVFRVTTIVPEQPLDEDEALWWIDGEHSDFTPSESETDRELKIYLRIPIPKSNPEKYEILDPAEVSP